MECPICYDAITAESGITTLACSHSYHLKCIMAWINDNYTCPCCRKDVSKYEKTPKKATFMHLERTRRYVGESPVIGDIDAMIDEVIQELATSDTLPVSRRYREVPILTLPPQIQRMNLRRSLNPNAPAFYPNH